MEEETFGFEADIHSGATFELFTIGIHYHHKDDTNPCYFRKGVFITVCNFALTIGMFRV